MVPPMNADAWVAVAVAVRSAHWIHHQSTEMKRIQLARRALASPHGMECRTERVAAMDSSPSPETPTTRGGHRPLFVGWVQPSASLSVRGASGLLPACASAQAPGNGDRHVQLYRNPRLASRPRDSCCDDNQRRTVVNPLAINIRVH